MYAHVFWTNICDTGAYAGMSSTAQAMCEPMLLATDLILTTTDSKHCVHYEQAPSGGTHASAAGIAPAADCLLLPQGRHLLENNITVNEHLSDIMRPRATAPRGLEHPLNSTGASGIAITKASPAVQAHRMLRLL